MPVHPEIDRQNYTESGLVVIRSVPFLAWMLQDVYQFFDRKVDIQPRETADNRHLKVMGQVNKKLERYAPGYLAWESVRHHRGLLVTQHQVPQVVFDQKIYTGLTGFEGYFVGMKLTPSEIFSRIAKMGEDIYQSYHRQYRTSPESFIQGLDPGHRPTILHFGDLESIFAAQLARSRAAIYSTPPGGKLYDRYANAYFRQSTITNVSGTEFTLDFTPGMYDDGREIQTPSIFQTIKFKTGIRDTSDTLLPDYDAFGYAVMSRIGILGHPVYRAYTTQQF